MFGPGRGRPERVGQVVRRAGGPRRSWRGRRGRGRRRRRARRRRPCRDRPAASWFGRSSLSRKSSSGYFDSLGSPLPSKVAGHHSSVKRPCCSSQLPRPSASASRSSSHSVPSLSMSSAQRASVPTAGRGRRRIDRLLQAVAVEQPAQRLRAAAAQDAVGRVPDPELVLLGEPEPVAVVVGVAVARVERVGVGPAPGIGQRQGARVVVEVEGGLELVAVLHVVRVGVAQAGIGLDRRARSCWSAGRRRGPRSSRRTGPSRPRGRRRLAAARDHRRQPARRELAELAGQHAQLEAGRPGLAASAGEQAPHRAGHAHDELGRARAARLGERRAARSAPGR